MISDNQLKEILEHAIKETNRILRSWAQNKYRAHNDYSAMRSLLISYIARQVRNGIGYHAFRRYGKPVVTFNADCTSVISLKFPNSWGDESYFNQINTITNAINYDKLSDWAKTHEEPTRTSEISDVQKIFKEIENIKF